MFHLLIFNYLARKTKGLRVIASCGPIKGLYFASSQPHDCIAFERKIFQRTIMPVKYSIDSKARLVTTVFFGIFTDSDIWHLIDQLRKDAEYDPDFDELIDCSGVTENLVSAGTLSAVRSSPKPRRAVVAPSMKNYGIARMFQALQTNQRIEIFRTLEEAREWLGQR